MNNLNLKGLLFAFGLILTSITISLSQPGGPGGGGDDDPDPIPIDGGISLLIGAGAALGAKKAYDLRKRRS
jgi:hypothetical protein